MTFFTYFIGGLLGVVALTGLWALRIACVLLGFIVAGLLLLALLQWGRPGAWDALDKALLYFAVLVVFQLRQVLSARD